MNRSPTLAHHILQRQDFWSGVIAVIIGGFFSYLSSSYAFGSLSSIGSGFMPRVVSYAITGIGLFILVRSLFVAGEDPVERIQVRSIAAILASVAVFAVAVPYGLATAIIGATIVARLAQPDFGVLETLLLGIILAVLCVLIFIVGLREPIAIGPF